MSKIAGDADAASLGYNFEDNELVLPFSLSEDENTTG